MLRKHNRQLGMRNLSIRRKIVLCVLFSFLLSVVGLVVLYLVDPLVFFFSLYFFLMLFRDRDYWTSEGCTREARGSIVSPDGQLEAKVFQIQCGQLLIQNDPQNFVAIAIVKPEKSPTQAATAMEINGAWPRVVWESEIAWKSASELQITVPQSAEVGIVNSVAGVKIDIERASERAPTAPAL